MSLSALGLATPNLLTRRDELPDRADAIFVFPGHIPLRPRCAAQLYHRGLAPRLVFSGESVRAELVLVGQPLSDATLNAKVAMAEGVPEAACTVRPHGSSTWDDVQVLAAWAAESQARRVIAVTSAIHSARARRSLRLVLGRRGVEVFVHSCDQPPSVFSAWWLDEKPLISIFNEALKSLLYLVRYELPTHLFGRQEARESAHWAPHTVA